MNRIIFCLLCLITGPLTVLGIDLQGLQPIGRITSVSKRDSGVLIQCSDESQVGLYVLAPDLIRIRASFGKPLASIDHSWAIAKAEWEPVKWQLEETSDTLS